MLCIQDGNAVRDVVVGAVSVYVRDPGLQAVGAMRVGLCRGIALLGCILQPMCRGYNWGLS